MKGTVLAYGEIMLRLAAVDGTVEDGSRLVACYGGTESNVLACLHQLGHDTQYLTALPDTVLGHAVIDHLHHYGVGTSHVKLGGDALGIYFVQPRNASRGSSVIYQRKYSEFTRICEADFDFDKIFDGVELFHVSGISYALSDSSRKLGFRLLEEANNRGVPVSFDFNYRAKLWTTDEARPILVEAAKHADILLASTLDLQTFLQTDENSALKLFPRCKLLSLRDRGAISEGEHQVSIRLVTRDGDTCIPTTRFDVKETIGGGDAYDGCLLHALLSGADTAYAAKFATAGFILKHQQEGDTFSADANEIAAYAEKL